MEKRLIRGDSLADAVKRIAQEAAVFAPVREAGNVLFRPLEGRAPELSYANTKNAPKNALFPHTETLVRYIRTPRGWEFAADGEEAGRAVLFVRPCDARSFVFLDKVFDQDKYRDPYYVAHRERSTVVSLACAAPPYAA
ncbi:MAG: 4Fe-4S ferredoxin, partial [Deltaproteobacteria bacterium]|nr:4Fe-4S ferredoxin [Deltaproteobacteria bacterium]